MTESLALVPVFTGTINAQSVQLCDARTLHTFMGVLRDFSNWIKGRILKFKFVEGVDYAIVENLSSPDLASAKSRPQTLLDYHLTLDMAKELAMVENNDKGREARRYFIACEKRAHQLQPDRISPQKRVIKTRDDLSFTKRNARGNLMNWALPPMNETESWSDGIELGRRYFLEVLELAKVNPKEATEALVFALSCEPSFQRPPGGFTGTGRGVEVGFAQAVAQYAVQGVKLEATQRKTLGA